MFDEVEERRVLDREILRLLVVVEISGTNRFGLNKNVQAVLLDVVNTAAHFRRRIRKLTQVNDRAILLADRSQKLVVGVVAWAEPSPRQNSFTAG